MSRSKWAVFLVAIFISQVTSTNAATSNTVSVKLDDIPVGKVIKVGLVRFVKVSADQYLAIDPVCGDHSHLSSTDPYTCTCDTGYYADNKGSNTHTNAGGSCSYLQYCNGSNRTTVYATSAPSTCTCASNYYSKSMTSTTANLTDSCYSCPSGWTYNSSYGGCYKNFAYTGGIQNFTTTYAGKYKLEVWGAQGGSVSGVNNYAGGYGGYSYGTASLTSNFTMYVVVGGQGNSTNGSCSVTTNGNGYNGGGTTSCQGGGSSTLSGSGGGGASHIASVTGLLVNLSSSTNQSKIYIVAGGGGGSASANYQQSDVYGVGGSGGGWIGVAGTNSGSRTTGQGGTQTAAGASSTQGNSSYAATSAFGRGCSPNATYPSYMKVAGGGGWYGGGCGTHAGGGGGSGHLNTSLLTNYGMKQYSAPNTTSTVSVSCANANHDGNCANTGAGYARVTLISIN